MHAEPYEVLTLPVEFAPNEIACEVNVEARSGRERLGTADRMPVVSERDGVCEEGAVRREVDECCANRSQPRERFKRDASGLTEQHEAFEAGTGAIDHEATAAIRQSIIRRTVSP